MLEQLATTPLTRKQFLLIVATFLVGFIGMERILKLGSSNSPLISRKPTSFSAGTYGGK